VQAGFAQVVAHAAVVAREVVALAFEKRLDEVEHGCELREDDDFVVGCLSFEDLEELADLGGGGEVGCVVFRF
jgi:hypothetical protein